MWPRTEEERLRRRNCGFVSFMKRSSAEDARDDLDGYELEGMRMTVNWVRENHITSHRGFTIIFLLLI